MAERSDWPAEDGGEAELQRSVVSGEWNGSGRRD